MSSKKSKWEVFGENVALMMFGCAVAAATGALAMLGFGVLHSYWPQIPPFGFFESWIIMITINMVGLSLKKGYKVEPRQ